MVHANLQQQSLRGHRVDEIALHSGPVGSDMMLCRCHPAAGVAYTGNTKKIASTWDS